MEKNLTIYCKYCRTFIIVSPEKPNTKYTCGKKECKKQQQKEYYLNYNKIHKEENIKRSTNWRKNNYERFKEIQKKYQDKPKNRKRLNDYAKKYYNEQRKNHNESVQKWRKTENGRKYQERHINRRYGYIEVLPNIFDGCQIDHHHIDKDAPSIVIPIPTKVHRSVNGGGLRDKHFDRNKKFIEKTYMINPDIFLGRF